jgi:hypothetical protein
MILPNAMLRMLLCGLILSGCQTAPSVYKLAEKTSANAGVFQQHLGDLADQSKTLASRRADHVASMDAFNADLDSYLKRELYMIEKSSKASEWSRTDALIKELTALRDELVEIQTIAKTSRQERRSNVLALYADLNTFQAAMRDTASALNALAKEESATERAAFLGTFLSDLRNNIRDALASDDAASQKAKALVDQFKEGLTREEQGETDGN